MERRTLSDLGCRLLPRGCHICHVASIAPVSCSFEAVALKFGISSELCASCCALPKIAESSLNRAGQVTRPAISSGRGYTAMYEDLLTAGQRRRPADVATQPPQAQAQCFLEFSISIFCWAQSMTYKSGLP